MTTTASRQRGKDGRFAAVPKELRDLDQWVNFRIEPNENGKPTKRPYNARTGQWASHSAPMTWATFDVAMSAAQEGNYSGIGFVFSDNDPYAGIDLDHVRDPESGALDPAAQRVIDQLNSYTEVSPSGTGVHVIVRGRISEGRKDKLPGAVSPEAKIEMYDRERYFTVTGDHLTGTPTTIETRQAEVAAIHAEVFPPRPQPNPSQSCGNGLTDDEVRVRMLTSRNASRIQALMDRADANIGDGSFSAGDWALLSELGYWTNRNAAQMERLFSESERGQRDKWRQRADYRETTIAKVIAATPEGFISNTSGAATLQPGESATYSLADFLAEVDDAQAALIGSRDNVILRPETVAILTGPPKALKTAQVFEMALATANGHPLYGQFPVPSAGAVLLIILESSRRLWRERFRTTSMQRGVDPSKVVVRFIKGRPGLVTDADKKLILQAIEETRPVLTIIDTLGRASAGIDLNNASEVTPLFAWMERVRDEHHTGFLLVHHANKNSDGTPEQGIGGSTAIFAGVDTWLSSVRVGKMEDKRVRVSVVHRDGEEPTPFVLKLKGEDRSDGLEPIAPWLHYEGASTTAPNPLRKAILAYFDNGVTTATIQQLVEEKVGTRPRVQMEVTSLVGQGFLQTVETTKGRGGAKVYSRTTKPDTGDDTSPGKGAEF